LQLPVRAPRPRGRDLVRGSLARDALVAPDLLAGPGRHRPGARSTQLHAGAPRLRQPDRDRLLGGPGAVAAPADVVDLLADELAGLGAGRLSFPLRLAGALQRAFLGH